jgi:hypothetical protein
MRVPFNFSLRACPRSPSPRPPPPPRSHPWASWQPPLPSSFRRVSAGPRDAAGPRVIAPSGAAWMIGRGVSSAPASSCRGGRAAWLCTAPFDLHRPPHVAPLQSMTWPGTLEGIAWRGACRTAGGADAGPHMWDTGPCGTLGRAGHWAVRDRTYSLTWPRYATTHASVWCIRASRRHMYRRACMHHALMTPLPLCIADRRRGVARPCVQDRVAPRTSCYGRPR